MNNKQGLLLYRKWSHGIIIDNHIELVPTYAFANLSCNDNTYELSFIEEYLNFDKNTIKVDRGYGWCLLQDNFTQSRVTLALASAFQLGQDNFSKATAGLKLNLVKDEETHIPHGLNLPIPQLNFVGVMVYLNCIDSGQELEVPMQIGVWETMHFAGLKFHAMVEDFRGISGANIRILAPADKLIMRSEVSR